MAHPAAGVFHRVFKFQIDIRRKVILMFFCFTGKFRDLLPVFFHDIHFSILLFILREKRGQLDLREKKKITVLCQITKFQAFLQVFLYISGHTHLRRCDFHAFPPHVSFFSFYHLEYAGARTRDRIFPSRILPRFCIPDQQTSRGLRVI